MASATPSQTTSNIDPSQDANTAGSSRRLYFGYGSNMWRHQMSLRCPSSKYIGLGVLNGWHWIINQRGYANVVPTAPTAPYRLLASDHPADSSSTPAFFPSSSKDGRKAQDGDGKDKAGEEDIYHNDDGYTCEVYGLVYSLTTDDEASLDENEGVPTVYSKEVHSVRLWPVHDTENVHATEETDGKHKDMLVYISHRFTTDGKAREEYVYRMNKAIEDAEKEGMPADYVSGVLRKWIPKRTGKEGMGEGEGALRWRAESQARRFEEGKDGGEDDDDDDDVGGLMS